MSGIAVVNDVATLHLFGQGGLKQRQILISRMLEAI
jgi:hypothetical protein